MWVSEVASRLIVEYYMGGTEVKCCEKGGSGDSDEE